MRLLLLLLPLLALHHPHRDALPNLLWASGLYNVHLFNKSPKNALGQRVFTALFAAGRVHPCAAHW